MSRLRVAREALRIAAYAMRTNLAGEHRYAGSAEQVCRRIVSLCWDGKNGYYRTSLGNYPLFYTRDFGMCADALLALGEEGRVRRTLVYALERYARHGRVTQQIAPDGRPFNFPDYESPDSLAFLLHGIAAIGDELLVRRYKHFLEREISRLVAAVVDSRTGLVQRGLRLAGMRDFAVRDSSCYDNCMLAAIAKYATRLRLGHPLASDYETLLLRRFWTGTHFRDDLGSSRLVGDANVAVFWFSVIKDETKERELFKRVVLMFKRERLDEPYALRYESAGATRMAWYEFLVRGWERDTVWLHLGNMWLQVLSRLDPEEFRVQFKRQRRLIEQEHNYPEVLTKDGKPYRGLFFHADGSILWAANYLAFAKYVKPWKNTSQ